MSRWLGLCLWFAVWAASADRATCQDEPAQPADRGRALADRFWKELEGIPGKDFDLAQKEQWDLLQYHGSGKFYDTVNELPPGGAEAFAERLTSRFARGGHVADIKWFVAMEEYATHYGSPSHDTFPPRDGVHRDVQIGFGKALTERFATDRDCLARYQHALAWRRRWLDPSGEPLAFNFLGEIVARLVPRFEPGSELYYWDARDFIVVLYTTGRTDLIPKSKEDVPKLHRHVKEWLVWFRDKGGYLRPQPVSPTWALDPQLEAAKYGYAPFFMRQGILPPPVYPASAPFPGWPTAEVNREWGLE